MASRPPDLPPLPAFTPRDVLRARYGLNVFCPACRVLRVSDARALADARPDQPLAEIRFRCGKCGGLGSPLLDWRDDGNAYHSFDFAKLPRNAKRPPG